MMRISHPRPHRSLLGVSILACTLCVAISCSKAKQDEAREKVKQAGDQAATAVAEAGEEVKKTAAAVTETAKEKTAELTAEAKTQRDALVRDLHHQMEAIDAGIASLQARVEHAQGAGKKELEESLATLRSKRAELRERTERLGASTGAAWDDLAAGTTAAAHDLAQAIDKALARFK